MFAVLHLADFALQAVLRTEPDAAQRPAALFSETGKKSLVTATTAAAHASGVALGMTAPQAVARCPTLLIRAPKAAAETEARAALLAVGFTLSPLIEDTAPGICTIELRGADLAEVPARCRHAVRELARLTLSANAGIARTPLLALYAARAAGLSGAETSAPATDDLSVGESPASALPPAGSAGASPAPAPRARALNRDLNLTRSSTSTITRKSTNDPGRPRESESESESESEVSGPVLHITDIAAFLHPLPLATADPPPELAGVLHRWGLRTLGDLTALPRDEIVRRFGSAGLALWQRAAGGDIRPLRPVPLPEEFAAQLELEEPVENLEPLLFTLRRFLDRLTLELRASQHVAAELQLTLRLEDDTQHARGFRLPEPTAEGEILFRTLHTHLESLTTPAAIVAIALAITPARPLVRQQGLFETGLRDPHGFAETLARVSALVGADRLGTPQLADTHRPDVVKLCAPPAVVPPPAAPPLHAIPGVPLRRFRPPLPARLEFTAGRPTYVWTEQVRGEISAQSQAWLSNGEWWEKERQWQRTEWDIALAAGGLYRLLRVGESYFLEGEYD